MISLEDLKDYKDNMFVWVLTLHIYNGRQIKKKMGTTYRGLKSALEAVRSSPYKVQLKVCPIESWNEVELNE